MLSRILAFLLGTALATAVAISYLERDWIADQIFILTNQLIGESAVTERSISMLGRQASRGDVAAARELARRYEIGEGVKADSTRAFEFMLVASEAGDPEAMRIVAGLMFEGNETEAAAENALNWLTQAAENGDAAAQADLGKRLVEGRGVPRDFTLGRQYLLSSAQQGNAEAQADLGATLSPIFIWGYNEATGQSFEGAAGSQQVFRDLVQSYMGRLAQWNRMAAESGNPRGQLQLGLHYLTGIGAEQDLGRAKQLFELARDQGNSDAVLALGIIRDIEHAHWLDEHFSTFDRLRMGVGDQGDSIDAARQAIELDSVGALLYMGFANIAFNFEDGSGYLRRAATAGNPEARLILAIIHADGILDELEWEIRDLAEDRYIPAMIALAALYIRDMDNWDTIEIWLDRMIELDASEAVLILGELYLQGVPEADSYIRVLRYAADRGIELAYHRLGSFYAFGPPNAWREPARQEFRDYEQASHWLTKALDAGIVDAARDLARLNEEEHSENADYDKIFSLYNKAASDGDLASIGALGRLYYYGAGTTQDYSEAYRHLSQYNRSPGDFIDRGQLIYLLGLMYEHGHGTERNLTSAINVYHSASVRHGNLDAQLRLEELCGSLSIEDPKPLACRQPTGE